MASGALGASGCPWVSPGSPLTCDVSQVARSKNVFDFPLLIFKITNKNVVDILVNLNPKWTPEGYPYLEEWDKDSPGIEKNTGLGRVYEKMRKDAQVHVLKGLILMLSPTRNHCFHFC